MIMSPLLIFFGFLSNFNPNFQGSVLPGFVCLIGTFLFLFGSVIFYLGKSGIAEREAIEQKRREEKEELIYLRKRVKDLEEREKQL
ncbi:MAG: hypothetical protein JSW11_08750 [Candidatus Heimdallarchaeota archaeon]|nr:MAG: hypothetical protein JSW11_08750 [Candidatus Heimdallarchaeota archaeon]